MNQKDCNNRIKCLGEILNDILALVDNAIYLDEIEQHAKTITILIQQVMECRHFITEYAKQKNFCSLLLPSLCPITTDVHIQGFVLQNTVSHSDIDATITAYVDNFKKLTDALLQGVAVQTGVTVFCMMNVLTDIGRSDGLRLWLDIHDTLNAEESIKSIKLDNMPYVFGARFQLEKGCLPGTCKSFLQKICEILNNPDDDAPRVCLLTGVAGSGKSAVAHSIA